MNPITQINKCFLLINVELLFDFRSILFTIARFTNDKFKFKKNLNQNFFNSLKFSNIDEFVNSFIKNESEDIDNESKNSEILKQNIKGNPVLNTVKPKLVSCSELSYLTKILKTKDNNLEVILFFKDNYYAEVLKKLEVESSFNKIFKNVSKLSIESIHDINFKEFFENNDGNNLIILIDNEQIDHNLDNFEASKLQSNLKEKLNSYPNNKILFYNKPVLAKKNNFESENYFEDMIKSICQIQSLDYLQTISIYKELNGSQFINKYSKEYINKKFDFLPLWRNSNSIPEISIFGKVIPGFKRGSKLLGVPTANIEITPEIKEKLAAITTGIYFGHFSFADSEKISGNFNAVLSIGYNPYFENECKTIEVFLIDYEGEDFYDEHVNLTIEGFLRTEASFENFSELVTAITYDIIASNQKLLTDK